MLRGNTVMKGYLKNPNATEEAFRGGWFHTGDLAVRHADGYVEVKDRSKDIIISGGENISSLEVEEALYRHPAVMEAAVVAMPDAQMGREPVRLRHPEAGCRPPTRPRSSPGAASSWRTSRRRRGSCSARCRRPRPARSRSSSCASGRSSRDAITDARYPSRMNSLARPRPYQNDLRRIHRLGHRTAETPALRARRR